MNKKNLLIATASAVGVFAILVSINATTGKISQSPAHMTKRVQKLTSDELLPTASKYSDAKPEEKAALLQKSVELSEVRKAEMLKLIQKDPAAAINAAMTDTQRASLPPEVRRNVEVSTTIQEPLQVEVIDDTEENAAGLAFGMGEGANAVQLHFAKPDYSKLKESASSLVAVRGFKLDNQMAVSESGASNIGGAGGAPTGSSNDTVTGSGGTGTKKVAVMLVNFANKKDFGFTAADAKKEVFGTGASVKSWYDEMSYGQTTITGDVFGPYTLSGSGPDSACDWTTRDGWLTAAKSQAARAGVNLSGYTNFVVINPKSSNCPGSGTGQINGSKSFINGKWNGWYTVIAHELGHNFGEWHSSTLSCTSGSDRVTFGGRCTASEYGDNFSIMGNSYKNRHLTSSQKGQIGILKPANTLTVTGNGTFTIAPAGKASTGIQALRIKLKNNFSVSNSQNGTESYPYYYMEFRQPTGSFDNFSSSDPVVKGVSIRLGGDYAAKPIHTQLLDATPGTATFDDAALAAGKTWTTPDGYIIKVTNVSASGATVQVSGFTTNQNPPNTPPAEPNPNPNPAPSNDTTPPSVPTLTGTAESSSSIRTNWTAATDNVKVTGYDIYRGETKLASLDANTRTYLITGLNADVRYKFKVVTRDAAGNTSTTPFVYIYTLKLGAPSSVPTGDQTKPTTPTAVNATSATASQINLAWNASTDNVGVTGYDIYRNSVKIGSSNTNSFGDTGLSADTTYNYAVVAFDAAGNRSAASGSYAVKTDIANVNGQTGTLNGYVHTKTNPQPIVGAIAKLYATDGRLLKTVVTNAQGTFTMPNLPAGNYRLEVTYNGSSLMDRTITITAGRTSNWEIWVY